MYIFEKLNLTYKNILGEALQSIHHTEDYSRYNDPWRIK